MARQRIEEAWALKRKLVLKMGEDFDESVVEASGMVATTPWRVRSYEPVTICTESC